MDKRFLEVSGDSEKRFNPLPSLFSLGNALCGLGAIASALSGPVGRMAVPPLAVWFLFGAMLFDVLDGLTARLLDARSLHGMNLDSLGDAISFGAAPAFFVHATGRLLLPPESWTYLLVWMLAGFYLCCALWRLAVYNVRAVLGVEKESRTAFVGLPSPAAAAMIGCMVWFMPRFDLGYAGTLTAFTGYTLLASSLMVSSIPYPHLRNLVSHAPWRVAIPLSALGLLFVFRFGLAALVLMAHLYLLSAPLGELYTRLFVRSGRWLGDPEE